MHIELVCISAVVAIFKGEYVLAYQFCASLIIIVVVDDVRGGSSILLLA